MQYGVGGAKTNTSANLLVFSFNTSVTPRAADFSVQLSGTTQPGNVSVLSTYSTSSDYLVRVRFGLALFMSNITSALQIISVTIVTCALPNSIYVGCMLYVCWLYVCSYGLMALT